MEITASMVKQLREMTGAGVMACKNALVETEGDFDKAVEVLRKKGEATAVKKAGRIAAEGTVLAYVDGNKAAIVEVNSETDFVAKNDTFRTFVADIAEQIIASDATTVEALSEEKFIKDESKTVKEELVSKIAVIGENLTIRRFEKINTNGVVVPYIHAGGKIGVLVEADTANTGDEVKDALKNIAMQIAALSPKYATKDEISAEELDKMREITIDSALNDTFTLPVPILKGLLEKAISGNVWSAEDVAAYEEKKNDLKYLPNFLSKEAKAALAELAMADKAEIIENKIFLGLVDGRIKKQLKDICLLEQTYVKAEDGKQTVAQYIAEVAKATGSELTLKNFVRFETGEGIEKKEENFAEEVAKQMAGN
ncbi:MAG: elongation factor Ts [Lachnospiraceae bacterium]|nr:elongation factor Ts [Lachnospiraceae bacterium]MBQ3061050.1 elongation factor Ts [Lachnospiraceae bacterium]MBQ6815245.1 elongation factor Ts [Lachnospiraceae bacterium]